MIFGVAGVPTNYKGKFSNLFDWLLNMGLNAFEIQCTYGFKVSDDRRAIITKYNNGQIHFSMHGPYFVNLGSLNKAVVGRSIATLKDGINLAKELGVTRIIFHPGGGHENTVEGRIRAINQLVDAINNITNEIDMGEVKLYPEIGGKTASLGSLDEIIDICKRCKYCYPCIDIDHLHAREVGSINTKQDLLDRLNKIKQQIPDKFKDIHFHAYTINYGEKGEIKHITHGYAMPDGSEAKPNLRDFIEVLKEMNIFPWVISEALDSQEIGAKYMRDLYAVDQ